MTMRRHGESTYRGESDRFKRNGARDGSKTCSIVAELPESDIRRHRLRHRVGRPPTIVIMSFNGNQRVNVYTDLAFRLINGLWMTAVDAYW